MEPIVTFTIYVFNLFSVYLVLIGGSLASARDDWRVFDQYITKPYFFPVIYWFAPIWFTLATLAALGVTWIGLENTGGSAFYGALILYYADLGLYGIWFMIYFYYRFLGWAAFYMAFVLLPLAIGTLVSFALVRWLSFWFYLPWVLGVAAASFYNIYVYYYNSHRLKEYDVKYQKETLPVFTPAPPPPPAAAAIPRGATAQASARSPPSGPPKKRTETERLKRQGFRVISSAIPPADTAPVEWDIRDFLQGLNTV